MTDRPTEGTDNREVISLRSNADTVAWGYIPTDASPVLRIRSGQTVRIETVSHQGLQRTDPLAYFVGEGIPAEEVLPESLDILRRAHRPEGASLHILTGPIHVAGAEPGDSLEIRILDLAFRVPYGTNTCGPGFGILPELVDRRVDRIIRLDPDRGVALFAPGVEIPLRPFLGVLAVAPRQPVSNAKAPGPWGGNIDLRFLTAGARLTLPVFQPGALFYAGDGHAVQGDGEVNGTALETSLTATLQLFLHKGGAETLRWPRGEDAAYHYLLGMDRDLNRALEEAVQATVDWLRREQGLSAAEAYALASLAVDFRVGEAVDGVAVVYGQLPKGIFL